MAQVNPRSLDRPWIRRVSFAITVAFLAIALLRLYATLTVTFTDRYGIDYQGYLAATRRWLETGTPYNAWEVAAPFEYGPLTFLHPPVSVLWFYPFLYLPWFVWWAIPIGAVAWSFAIWRPAWWSWPVMAGIVAVFTPAFNLVVGNSNIWACAAVAMGLIFGWPALAFFMKTSLAPLALIGSWSRSWWIGAGIGLLLCIPFGALWVDWVNVVINSPGDLLYSAGNIPWIMVPAIAWYAATRPRPTWSHRSIRA